MMSPSTEGAPAPNASTPRAKARRWLTPQRLFALHGWLGMHFGLLLALVCLSGAVATLTHEIEWLSEPALRIDPRGPVRWEATREALEREYPGYAISGFGRSEASVIDGLAWDAYVTAPDGSWGQVRVDPYAAAIVRPASRLYLTDYIRQFHYNFHSSWGYYLVCFVAFPLLLSVLSGLLFYKGWWRHLFRLRLRGGARAFFSSLHRLLGVWSLLFGLIIGVTGVWYLVESEIVPSEVAYPSGPKIPPGKLAAHGEKPRPRPLEECIAAARAAFPELEPTGVSLPEAADDALAVQGRAGRALMRDRANAVFLDPFDASVIAVRKSSESGAVQWWVDAADALHFGYWGGLATKLLWALLALCLPALILSGAYLSWRRAGVLGAGNPAGALPWWRRYPVRTWILAPVLCALAWSCAAACWARLHAPALALGEGALAPAAPAAFFPVVWTLALASSGLALLWLTLDRRAPLPSRGSPPLEPA